MNYYEHHIGDYAAATAHLSWDEDMAYTRLLRAYYHHERGIPQGQQYRLARASTPAQRRAVDSVLAEFFTLTGDTFTQKRADAELARFRDKQDKARRSAEARWSAQRPQSERNANASTQDGANAMRTHSEGNALQTPYTRHQTPITPPTPQGGRFAEFWNAYPKTPRKAARVQCERKWRSKGCEEIADAVLASLEAHKASEDWRKDSGAFIPAPLVWLNQSRWEAPVALPSPPAVDVEAEARRKADAEWRSRTPEQIEAARKAREQALSAVRRVA